MMTRTTVDSFLRNDIINRLDLDLIPRLLKIFEILEQLQFAVQRFHKPITWNFVFRYSDIIDVQKEIKAASFAECSALTGFNVVEVFERAARIVVANRANGDKVKMGCTNILKSCSIM